MRMVCVDREMNRRLSDTWKQQKQGDNLVGNQNMKMGRKRSTRNRSLLTKSLLRSPDVSTVALVGSEIVEERECFVSPPAKTKKICDVHEDNMTFGMSIDWGCGDSILNIGEDIASPIHKKSPINQPVFTKIIDINTSQIPSQHIVDGHKESPTNEKSNISAGLQNIAAEELAGIDHEQSDKSPNLSPVVDGNKGVEIIDNEVTNKSIDVPFIAEGNKEVECINQEDSNSSADEVQGGNCSLVPQVPSVGSSLHMSSWGLPESVLQCYKKNGIEYMFPWQKECLLTGEVLNGGNLVYSAPTSAGKTLVAEILMLKRVIDTKKKALYILPFVSVTREKMYSLRELYTEVGIKVDGFMGSDSPAGGLSAVDVAICTIEKANSLINRLMEEKKISCLSCIVVDELHMIGDSGRGYLLELLLTKIRFVSSRLSGNDNGDAKGTVQLIGMSATLPNLKMLAAWLAADLYFTGFRPVPLSEHIKVGSNLFDKNNNQVLKVADHGSIRGDEDGVVPLCIQTIKEGNSVLIFCPTKNWCEKLAETISNFFSSNTHLMTEESSTFKKASKLIDEKSNIEDILDQLRNCPVGLEENIENMVKQRISFHHAGLTYDERDIIEGAFRRGILRVLVATSTLSSGVNLPAKRVIIRSPMFYGRVLDSLVYKQMSGRAGRKGIDTLGESIIICKTAEKKNALSLLQSDLRPVYSCLLDGGSSRIGYRTMKRALLEIITGGIAVTPEDVAQYEKMTYLHTCMSELKVCDFKEVMGSTIDFLVDNEFITLQEADDDEGMRYYPTQLGSACLASSFSPDEALIAFSELRKARKHFVLENELHLIYQVTPIYLQDQWADLDWYLYYNLWDRLPAQFKDVGKMVGVEEGFLSKAVRNRIQTRTEKQLDILRIHRRFYTALVLQELVNEVPLPVISRRYKINKGMLQTLQNASATFAGMLTVFCHKLGWTCLELLLDQFQSRLTFGVSRELCNLVRISLVSGSQARLLYDRGYESVSTIAFANKDDIASLLRESIPFESKVSGQIAARTKENCRNIWLIGKEGLTEHEAAALIITEAQKVLKADAAALGLSVHVLDEKKVEHNSHDCSSHEPPLSSSKKNMRPRNYLRNGRLSKAITKGKSNVDCSSNKMLPDLRNISELEKKETCIEMLNARKRKSSVTLAGNEENNEKSTTRKSAPFSQKELENYIQMPNSNSPMCDKIDTEKSAKNIFLDSSEATFENCLGISNRVSSLVKSARDNDSNMETGPSIQPSDPEFENCTETSSEKKTSPVKTARNKNVKDTDKGRSSLLFSDPEFKNCIETLNEKNASQVNIASGKNAKEADKRRSSLLFSDLEFENCIETLNDKETSPAKLVHNKKNRKETDKRCSSRLLSDSEFEDSVESENEMKTFPDKSVCDKGEKIGKRKASLLYPDPEFGNCVETLDGKEVPSVQPGSDRHKDMKRKRSSLLFSDAEFENRIDTLNANENCPVIPVCDEKDEMETDKSSSSLLFSDTEFDVGVLDISSTPVVKNLPTVPHYHERSTHDSQTISTSKMVKHKDEPLHTIPIENEVERLPKSCHNQLHDDKREVVGVANDGTSELHAVGHQVDVTQFVNLSNDSMFLLSNSLLQPLSSPMELLPSNLNRNPGENNNTQQCHPHGSVEERSHGLPVKLESRFNEFFSEEERIELNSARLDSNEEVGTKDGTRNTDDNMVLEEAEKHESRDDMAPEESTFSQDLFKDNSIEVDDTRCDEFLIIDVASDKELFSTFRREWGQKKRCSLCFACESVMQFKNNSIGRNIRSEKPSNETKREYVYSTDEIALVGLAVCWGGKDAYYVNLEPNVDETVDLNDTSLAPVVAKELSISCRLNVLKSMFLKQCYLRNIICYDMKDQLKIIYGLFESLLPNSILLDPKVAHWILEPSEKVRNLHGLVIDVLGEDYISILEAVGGEFGIKGLEHLPYARGKSRMRACVESVLVYNVMEVFEEKLKTEGLYQPYIEVEMPAVRTMTVIEINGIGFSNTECEKLKEMMKGKLASIERECYQLAHRTFSMTSPDEVSRILFVELGLPPNGIVEESPARRPTRSKSGVKRKRFSTCKAVLEKLQKLHRLPKLILEWRRVNSALSKVVYPLQRKKVSVEMLEMARVYSEPQYHTCTGRMMFAEPNLQNVPREFDIKLPIVIGDSPPVGNKGKKVVRNGLRTVLPSSSHPPVDTTNPVSPGEVFALSIRSVFVPFKSAMFISADYCQLELRIIAHLSGDKRLIEVLNTASDVFKGIAAKINHVSIDNVNDTQRQHAKEICYGIIYGMGTKTLSEQLDVSEDDACAYMEQFKDKYCGIKHYIRKTVEMTRKLGYVTTLGGRRRYIPAINSSNSYAKSQSERQTINTAVQGSAADLVKKAMNSIDGKLLKQFGYTCINRRKTCSEQRGGYLVLQLHDELMYEVSRKEVNVVSEIVRAEMENVWQLSVKLPVRIKAGHSWGSLKEV